jgi:hypothetical protein
MMFKTKIGVRVILGFMITGLSVVASAVPIQVQLLKPLDPNPETGENRTHLLNPAGTANLSFFGNGLRLTFQDEANKEQSLKIHFDFKPEGLITTEEQQKDELLWATLAEARKQGSLLVGKILQQVLSQPNASQLIFNRQGQMGFFQWDFEGSDVVMSAPELSPLPETLQNIAIETIYAELSSQHQKQETLRAQKEKAPVKNPIGFVWDHDSPGAVSCQKSLVEKTSHAP